MNHRLNCPPESWLDAASQFRAKTTAGVKKHVIEAASGALTTGRPVVHFSNDELKHTAGPDGRYCERERKLSGFLLFFNSFWLVLMMTLGLS